jgi:tRNA modification GTPase
MSKGSDPIAAISTPIGEGGVAMVRISGEGAIAKAASIFKGKDLTRQASHTVHLGWLLDGAGEPVDQVLATLFHAPHSYTGEETVELTCHGGVLVTQAVLEAVLASGVRAAQPGEFTQRAFLNGKISLEQAEAVADLIHASSRRAVDAARQQLSGRLGDHIRAFRQEIIDATAMVELELDFSEEDVEFADKEKLRALLSALDVEIGGLLATYEAGRLIKDGVRTAIIGRPNAGKSTLLNALVGEERAIVTDIPGTTRDRIDVDWSHGGVLFRLMDTAGLRETEDVVEAEGVRRSREAFQQADLVVYLKDASSPMSAGEREEIAAFRQQAEGKPFLLIGTKTDLAGAPSSSGFDLTVSAATGHQVETLKDLLHRKALQERHGDPSSLLVTSSRHRDALSKARNHVAAAIACLDHGLPGDILSIDLRASLRELGAITGEITTEDILDSIFSRFCIGK